MIKPAGATGQAISIIAGDRLRPGDVVSARISDILPGNRFRIVLNGRSMTAESHLSLQKGQVIHARVEQNGSGTLLRLLDPKGLPSENHPGGNPDVLTGKQLLTAAFLRASLALPGESDLQRMGTLLERSRGRRIRLARLQADLVARGADPSADFLEALDELLGGGEGKGKDHGGRGKTWPGVPEPEDFKEELQEESKDPLLQLVNSSPSKAGTWTFHRMKRILGDRELLITWKIRRGREPALALTVNDSGRILEFVLRGLDPARMSVYADRANDIAGEKWELFRKRLSLMKILVDDTISPMEASDGFEGA